MKIISRYLTTQIINSSLLTLFVLVGLEILIGFINQLSDMGVGNYGLWQVLFYISLDLPYQLYTFFPMIGLIGSLLGLSLLANQNELIAMRAAGFSTQQVLSVVLKMAFCMTLLAIFLGEVVAPYTEHIAVETKLMAKNNGQAVSTKQGLWVRVENDFVHIKNVVGLNHIREITSYEFTPQQQLAKALSANSAEYSVGTGRWLLKDVKITTLGENQLTTTVFPQMVWNINLDPRLLKSVNSEPRNMSLIELRQFIHYLKKNGLQANSYELNFWKRVLQPFATLIMITLAIPFVFGSIRSIPIGMRIMMGIGIGFSFYLLNQFIGPLSYVYQIPPLLAAILPAVLFGGIGGFLFWRMS